MRGGFCRSGRKGRIHKSKIWKCLKTGGSEALNSKPIDLILFTIFNQNNYYDEKSDEAFPIQGISNFMNRKNLGRKNKG